MTQSTIEHIVLIKVKDDSSPSKINFMLDTFNSLISLDIIHHLSLGPIYKIKSTSSSFNFTHLIHLRFKNREDLEIYLGHQEHTNAVNKVKELYGDNVMVIDYVAENLDESLVVPSGDVLRLSLLKLKEGLEETDKTEVLKVISEIKTHFGFIKQFSFGENFSPVKTNGYSIASVAIVPGLSELETFDMNQEVIKEQKEKLKEYVESFIVVDYVVPPVTVK